MKYALLIALVVFSLATFASGEDSTFNIAEADSMAPDSARIILRIERRDHALARFTDTIDISLQSTGQLMAGFDLKVATSNQYVAILNILPGEIYDSCEWDYFSARPLQRIGKEGYPPSLWQTVGMAEGITDSARPRCFGLDRPASLVRVVISNAHILEQVDTATAIYFFWEDCTDNVVSSATGERLYISTNVLDYFSVSDEMHSGSFPTRHGAPKECMKPGAINPALRRVEFHNGGVRFALPADSRGAATMSPAILDSSESHPSDSTKAD